MGSGKSAIGRRLAYLTGYRFTDSDSLITQAHGQTIADIFANQGETYFRTEETRTLNSLVGVYGIILSTGGGAIMNPENRKLIHKIGMVAWLDANPDLLFERVSRNRKRPLLHTENPRATFDALLAERLPIYKSTANFRVDSSTLTHEQTAKAVLEAVRKLSR